MSVLGEMGYICQGKWDISMCRGNGICLCQGKWDIYVSGEMK